MLANKTINIAELVADKIKTRYAEITEASFDSKNMVVDTFYPTYVRKSLTEPNFKFNLSKKISAISPFIANEIGCFQIPIKDLTHMLGYSKSELKLILGTIKSKKLNLVLVGLGGTGMNFMHWATEIANYTNSVNIFQSIDIFDQDRIDFTNLFRFPILFNKHYNSSIISPAKIECIDTKSVLSLTNIQTYLSFIEKHDLINPVDNSMFSSWKNKILYGAPDILTREMFSEIPDLKFVSGTHGNDDCQLYIKPPQDSNLQMESYGMINLSVFFMNQLKLTISFLELLASNEDLTVPSLIMDYSFAKEYSNGNIIKSGLTRAYDFPFNANNFIDQEPSLQAEAEPILQEQEEELSEPQAVVPVTTTVRKRRSAAEMELARSLGLEPPKRARTVRSN